MSLVAALLPSRGERPPADGPRRVRAMLAAMDPSASAASEEPGGNSIAALGATSLPWERALRAAAPSVAHRGTTSIACDATLTYKTTLAEGIGDLSLARGGDAALALAAYARWGVPFLERLEGEWALVLWDGTSEQLIAARSFTGHRPLFFARAGDDLLVASSVGGLLADRAIVARIDLAALATSAAGLWGHARGTAFEGIEELPAGHALTCGPRRGPRLHRFWEPPTSLSAKRAPLDPAAAELRDLLMKATEERLAPTGPTALSLSGGWDSTAVGGTAVARLGRDAPERLRPVSISYPEGDPGREDETITEVAGSWGIVTSWIPAEGIDLFSYAAERAGTRDLPFAHAFEEWNRSLSRAARGQDAHVILDGAGGDQLFQVSDVFLSDLFGTGRWVELARQWRGRGGRGLRNFWRWAVRPALPAGLTTALARVRGLPAPPLHFHRPAPPWFEPGFLERHAVLEREAAARPVPPRGSRVLAESSMYLGFAYFPRILGLLRAFAREEGVELRSPLLDDRVVRFAMQRPWSDRVDGGETKILLRRAMRGLVPDAVLAPRKRRTGVTSAYFLRQLRGAGRPVIEAALRDPLLASLGMIDVQRLRRAWEHVLQHDDDETGARIAFTVQAELWTRANAASLPGVTA